MENESIYNKKWEEISEKYTDVKNNCLKLYNKLAPKNEAFSAISIFSRNVDELEKKHRKLINRIDVTIRDIKYFVSVEQKQDDKIKEAAQIVNISLNQTFSYLKFGLLAVDYVEKETLQKELKNFCEIAGGKKLERHIEYMADVENAYRKRKIFENILIHQTILNNIISEVLERGYPIKLESESIQQSEEIKAGTGGRPTDKSVQEEKLKGFVENIIKKAYKREEGFDRFLQGRNNKTLNKSEIARDVVEAGLQGYVGFKTVKRRIDGIIEKLNEFGHKT